MEDRGKEKEWIDSGRVCRNKRRKSET